jgi:hypothetical protein
MTIWSDAPSGPESPGIIYGSYTNDCPFRHIGSRQTAAAQATVLHRRNVRLIVFLSFAKVDPYNLLSPQVVARVPMANYTLMTTELMFGHIMCDDFHYIRRRSYNIE